MFDLNEATRKDTADAGTRAIYQAPELVVFGSALELTASGTNGFPEANRPISCFLDPNGATCRSRRP